MIFSHKISTFALVTVALISMHSFASQPAAASDLALTPEEYARESAALEILKARYFPNHTQQLTPFNVNAFNLTPAMRTTALAHSNPQFNPVAPKPKRALSPVPKFTAASTPAAPDSIKQKRKATINQADEQKEQTKMQKPKSSRKLFPNQSQNS